MTHMLRAFFLLISACSTSEKKHNNDELNHTLDSGKVLIVYLSRTNNTKTVAEIIHQKVEGTLVALELEKPYPETIKPSLRQVTEENETGYLPPIKQKLTASKTIMLCLSASLLGA